MFRLKIINKSKDTHKNISNCTVNIVKFFIGFDTLFLADVCKFSERACRFMG